MRQPSVFVLVAVFAVFPGFTGANDDLSPSFDEVISLLKMEPSVKRRALAGEIVMLDRESSMEKELALALVAVIKRPYNEVIDAVKENRLFHIHLSLNWQTIVSVIFPQEKRLKKAGMSPHQNAAASLIPAPAKCWSRQRSTN